jgi:hypothetical protein
MENTAVFTLLRQRYLVSAMNEVFLSLIKHYAMTYPFLKYHSLKTWGVEVQLHAFSPLALEGDVVSFTSRPLYPQGKAPCTL